MKLPLLIFVAMAVSPVIAVRAQNPDYELDKESNINVLVASIVEDNSELVASRSMIGAQRADDADANSLANPEVEFARVWGRRGIGNKLQLDISQSFDWPGLYRARRQAAAYGISASEMMVMSQRLELSMQAKQLLLELVYVRKQLDLQNALKADLKRLGKVVEDLADNGELTILDNRKIAMEEFKLDSGIGELLSREQQILAALQAINNGRTAVFGGIKDYPIEPILTVDEYLAQMNAMDPALGAQRLMAEQENANARVAAQSRYPNFSLGYQHQAEMGDRFNGFTVGMSLPFFENRHARSAALARKGAAEVSVQLLTAQKAAEIASQLKEMEIWKRQIDSYNMVFGDKAYLTLLAKAYEGGELSVLDYIQEIQYYQEVTMTYLSDEYNYCQAVAALNKYSLLNP